MFFNSKIFTALISVVFVWVLFSVISVSTEKNRANKEEQNILSKIDKVTRDNNLLEKFIKNFEKPGFLEKEARLRLNYKSADEEVVFIHKDLSSQKASLSDDFSFKKFTSYKKWFYGLLGL